MAEKSRKWPPIDWLWQDYSRDAAWYSGDPARIQEASRGQKSNRFWASDEKIKVHVPVAGDIAALGAGMIFSQSPKMISEDAHTQDRIDEISEKTGLYSTLLQAAELCCAMGGVFLKLTWNEKDGMPRIFAVPADCGLAKWRGGELSSVTLWAIVREDENGGVWRTEETYADNGHIYTKLFKGDGSNLGQEAPLSAIEETAQFKEDADSGAGMLLAAYVPNMLPNRRRPYAPFGRSDYAGLYGLFDALDEAYSALQRETRMTKTTVIVPAEYLRRRDALFGEGNPDCRASQWVYSNDTGAFTALDIDSDRTSSTITVVNPEIRSQERLSVCDDLIRKIWMLAGYSPQSTGMDISGTAESGTALNIRERKTLRTAEVKKTYWWHALQHMVQAMLRVDAAVFRSGVKADAPLTIEMPSSAQPDLAQMAEVLEQLERAGAVSTQTKIDLLHPDWDEKRRADELARILEEQGAQAQMEADRILRSAKTPEDE